MEGKDGGGGRGDGVRDGGDEDQSGVDESGGQGGKVDGVGEIEIEVEYGEVEGMRIEVELLCLEEIKFGGGVN